MLCIGEPFFDLILVCVNMSMAENEQDAQREAEDGGQNAPFGLPLAIGGGEQFKEDHIQHGAAGKAHGDHQSKGGLVADKVTDQGTQNGGGAAEGGNRNGGAGLGTVVEEGEGDAHALRNVV